MTESGIFGQSNVVHVVRDEAVAQQYLDYWRVLAKDPSKVELQKWCDTNSPIPDIAKIPTGVTTLFSPRATDKALRWYVDLAAASKTSTFMTAAFGVNKLFAERFADEALPARRFLLLEKRGRTFALLEKAKKVYTALGSILDSDGLESAQKFADYRASKTKPTSTQKAPAATDEKPWVKFLAALVAD